jgi:hypothetical protein
MGRPPRDILAMRARTAGSEQDDDAYMPSDSELGVGEETPGPDEAAAKIAATMSDPVIAKAIEELVEQRVRDMALARSAVPQAPAGADFMDGMRELGKMIADSINRSTAATVEQMPGHVKPIPVEEVEARAAAWTEAAAILRDTTQEFVRLSDAGEMIQAEAITPIYLLKEDFFGPGAIGSEMYVAGKTIRWFAMPNVSMEPRNGVAKRISDAMWRYMGNERPPNAEELAAHASQMNRPSMPGANVPEVPSLSSRAGRGRGRLGASEVDTIPEVDVGPDRILGTIVRETKGGFGRGPRAVTGIGY